MPRRFGKWTLAMATFGTGTSSDQAVTVASKCYVSGASGIWYQWLFMFATPFLLAGDAAAPPVSCDHGGGYFRGPVRSGRRVSVLRRRDCSNVRFPLDSCSRAPAPCSSVERAPHEQPGDAGPARLSFLAYSIVGDSRQRRSPMFQSVPHHRLFVSAPARRAARGGGMQGMKGTLGDPAMFTAFHFGRSRRSTSSCSRSAVLAMLVMIPQLSGSPRPAAARPTGRSGS